MVSYILCEILEKRKGEKKKPGKGEKKKYLGLAPQLYKMLCILQYNHEPRNKKFTHSIGQDGVLLIIEE